jgi:hypothetical protein
MLTGRSRILFVTFIILGKAPRGLVRYGAGRLAAFVPFRCMRKGNAFPTIAGGALELNEYFMFILICTFDK